MKILFTSLFLLTLTISLAQNSFHGVNSKECSASKRNNEIIKNNPLIQKLLDDEHKNALKWTEEHYGEIKVDQNGKKTVSYIVPVVWHVIHNNSWENISRASIENEIAALNEDFQKLNIDLANAHPTFAGISADSEIEFRLARLDPDGNCTEGITRTESPLTHAMDESVKFLPGAESWNRNGRYYLNIWMGRTIASGAGGYAYYPGTVGMDRDGIIIRAQQLGNTLTHEAGHWLNLKHLWGGSNNPGLVTNCDIDDGVADTPNTIGQTGCSETAESCGSIDNVQNYMEYNQSCRVMFTEGQKQRMHSTLNSDIGKRLTMASASNLTLTGTDDPYVQDPACILIDVDFTYSKDWICEGDSVTFADIDTYNGTPTQWSWSFAGGTPSSSSIESPTITYNTEGVYSVMYSPGNAAGFATPVIKNDIITVSSLVANYILPISEGFESTSTFSNDWTIQTQSGNGWQITTDASFLGVRSLRIFNAANNDGDITEAISPSYDFTSLNSPVLTYDWAFAKKVSGDNDQFIIYKSTNCGESWSVIALNVGSSMTTATNTFWDFTPLGISDWDNATVSLASLAGEPNVRFKLYFKNAGGNNFFLDNFNISGAVNVNEANPFNNLKVYPNPMNESASLKFNLINNIDNLSVIIRDVLGKDVTKIISNTSFSAGQYTLSIDRNKNLSSGLYFIEFNADDNIQVEKLIVE